MSPLSALSASSLQKQLLFWIMLALLLVAVLAGSFSFYKTYHDLNQMQRKNLQGIAHLLSSKPHKGLPPHIARRMANRLERREQRINRYNQNQQDGHNNNNSPANSRISNLKDSLQNLSAEEKQVLRKLLASKDRQAIAPTTPTLQPMAQPNRRFENTEATGALTEALNDNPLTADNDQAGNEANSYSSDNIRVDDIYFPLNRQLPEYREEIIEMGLLSLNKAFDSFYYDGSEILSYRLDSYNDKGALKRSIIVTQKAGIQEDLAFSGAIQSFLWIVLAMVLLMLLLPLLLNKLFRPVRQLSHQVASRDEQDLSMISLDSQQGKGNSDIPQELQPLVDEINQLLGRVSSYIDRQRRFIADASHELRSPLTAISLQVQRLQRLADPHADTQLSAEQRMIQLHQGMDKLGIRVTHNQHLVEQLLTFARIDAGQMQSTSSQLLPILTEAVMLLLPIADTKQIELSVNNQLESTEQQSLTEQVALDETSLMMLFKNLIQNAILYTKTDSEVAITITDMQRLMASQQDLPADSQRKLVSILHHKEDKQETKFEDGLTGLNGSANSTRLVVQISDNGCGLPIEAYHDAFVPFVRIDTSQQNTAQSTSDAAPQADIQSQSHAYETLVNSNSQSKFKSKPKLNKVSNDENTKPTYETINKGTGLGLAIVYQICQQAGIDIYLSATNANNNDGNNDARDCLVDEESKGRGLTVTLVFADTFQRSYSDDSLA